MIYLENTLASQSLCDDNTSEAHHGCPAIPVFSLGGPDTVGKRLLAGVSPTWQIQVLKMI